MEQRCLRGTNAAEWFVRRVHDRLGTGSSSGSRGEALRLTLLDYRERMHSNEPVHAWD